jgi:DNA-binding SARP family transcriptional activator
MPILNIQLLGGQPSINIDGRPCKVGVRKAEAMLYFCLRSSRPVSVLSLCDLMWPEAEDKKARQNLNDAFWSLRKGLREAQATEL